ncbi:MAG TPA: Asp23/Gls24 family envelope stress response protein [Thermomicrobiales bacterium]|nr:Asp23/Gls24 family envelope stress response protein [Thermomicrobiales bacterium]
MSEATPGEGPQAEGAIEEATRLGRVMIAPVVLAQIVERTALGVPGVAAMCARHPRFERLRGRAGEEASGVRVGVVEGVVNADLAIVADADVNILELGRHIQREVAVALRQMVGMDVGEVNVYVDDVRLPGG